MKDNEVYCLFRAQLAYLFSYYQSVSHVDAGLTKGNDLSDVMTAGDNLMPLITQCDSSLIGQNVHCTN